MPARRWLALTTLALLLVVPLSGAQSNATAPRVEIEDVEIPGLVVPMDEPGETMVEVRIGCEAHEVPATKTVAELHHAEAPDWANVIVSPSELSWMAGPGDCPSQTPPFRRNVSLSVSLDQGAPGYEETTFSLAANVAKESPESVDNRSYGPHRGNVTLTPGYFHLHNVRIDEKIKEAAPDESLTFDATIQSFANHETAFTLRQIEPVEHEVRYEPSKLVLAPGEGGEFSIEVGPPNASASSSAIVTVQTRIQGNSTHPLGGEGGTSQVSVLAKFAPEGSDLRDATSIPGPGPLVVAILPATIALARAKRTGDGRA